MTLDGVVVKVLREIGAEVCDKENIGIPLLHLLHIYLGRA